MTFHLPSFNPLLWLQQPWLSLCTYAALVVAMVKSPPSRILSVQTPTQHSYRFLLEEIEGWRAKNTETPDGFSQLCDSLYWDVFVKPRWVFVVVVVSSSLKTSCTVPTSSGITFKGIIILQAALAFVFKIIIPPVLSCKTDIDRGRPCLDLAGEFSYHAAPW